MDEKTKRIADAYKKVYGDSWREMFAKYHWCVYDGGEIGSTGVLVFEKVTANDNFAPVDYRLAA